MASTQIYHDVKASDLASMLEKAILVKRRYNRNVMATTTARAVYSHITKDPKVCGGRACIDVTRIRVMDIVALLEEGYAPEKMLNVFAVPLTLAQVYAALAYYYDHKEEIEASFAEQDHADNDHERKRAEYLKTQTQR